MKTVILVDRTTTEDKKVTDVSKALDAFLDVTGKRLNYLNDETKIQAFMQCFVGQYKEIDENVEEFKKHVTVYQDGEFFIFDLKKYEEFLWNLWSRVGIWGAI